jgi:HTH-type transcriptional regulator/antitoxin HigA
MKREEFDAAVVGRAWAALQKGMGGIGVIRSERQYDRMVRLMNLLIDVVGADERHELASLLDIVGDLVANYETREVPVPDAAPQEVLRLLMDANGLTQSDLRAELGGQSAVSAVLAGKRAINARQAKALAARFNISPAAFIA